MLGVCCCVQAFSSCGELGRLFAVGAWASHAVVSLEHAGFSSCDTGHDSCGLGALEHGLKYMWHMGLVALLPVGSSWTGAQTSVLFNNWTTREVPQRPC